MAVGLRYFNENLWLDKYFVTLTFKEKLVWIHLITKQSTGGIFCTSVSAIEGVLNSCTLIEKMDNGDDYNENDYLTRKDITSALRKFNDDKKLIKMEDGYYFFVNFYKNQNYKSQNNLEGVIARTEELIDKNKNIGETLKQFPIYFEQLGERLVEMLKKVPPEKSKEKALGYKQRMFLKYATLLDKVKVFFSEQVTDYLNENLSMNYHYLYTKEGTKSTLSPDQVGDLLGDNYNLNLNSNFNFNFNLKEKLIVKDSIVKNKTQVNPDSSKILSLGGQDFLESSVEGEKQKPTIKERLIQEGVIEEDKSNPKTVAKIITGYFRKAFKRFEISLVPVVSVNIIEKAMKDYDNIADLENDARNVIEYLMTTEKIREVQDVKELPALLKWYRSKIAPKMNDKVKKV